MKKILISTLFVISTLAQQSDVINFERIIKDETHNSKIRLDFETVRCSAIGYGIEELKISVPSLSWYAVLDHSNRDGRGPCVTAGSKFCSALPILNVQASNQELGIPPILLDTDKPFEEVPVRVILEEKFSINKAGRTCHRYLSERIELTVRGIDFNHLRQKSLGVLSIDECERIFDSL